MLYRFLWRVKDNLYCMQFNRTIKTLLYTNCGKLKSISVISMLAVRWVNINYAH